MKLRLQFPPTPEFAAKHSEIAVAAVQNAEGVSLNYAPESLKAIDRIIQGFWMQKLKEEQIAETVFSFGCYAGEVLVRNLNGAWAEPRHVMPEKIAEQFPFMVIKVPSGHIWSPINKAFKQLANGEVDNFEHFYKIAANP